MRRGNMAASIVINMVVRAVARAAGGGVAESVFEDPATQSFIRRGLDRLREEFRGTFSTETIEHFVTEAMASLGGARLREYVPLFVHRFARERLRALGQVQGTMGKDVPEVLFVCVHNAGRSQMAAGLLERYAAGRVHVRSAGSSPTDQINPAVVQVMGDLGVDISKEFPKPLTEDFVSAADVVITMGCGDACPIYPGKRYEDWEVDDPAGKSLAEVMRIRDDIDARVRRLLERLVPSNR